MAGESKRVKVRRQFFEVEKKEEESINITLPTLKSLAGVREAASAFNRLASTLRRGGASGTLIGPQGSSSVVNEGSTGSNNPAVFIGAGGAGGAGGNVSISADEWNTSQYIPNTAIQENEIRNNRHTLVRDIQISVSDDIARRLKNIYVDFYIQDHESGQMRLDRREIAVSYESWMDTNQQQRALLVRQIMENIRQLMGDVLFFMLERRIFEEAISPMLRGRIGAVRL